jgi:hypothetical protein
MNSFEIVFLKNYDLKTQKITFSNRMQWSAFLKTRNFKRVTCDFKCQTAILPNCTFSDRYF